MTRFSDFLRARLGAGGFSTEDTLASFLPLVREVLEAHAAGCVAPLEGLERLHVEGVRIWFEEAHRQPPRDHLQNVRRLEAGKAPWPVEVIATSRRTTDVDDGRDTTVDLSIGKANEEIRRPVYLPGYIGWEHRLEHHDPLTDIFSLGMILASLACGMDFHDEQDLEKFVRHRRNLFEINRDLHPVLAQVIYRMTELNRHHRVQNLAAVLRVLEHYRAQDIDFEFDLARIEGFEKQDRGTKQELILCKLRERLFEISRRNRLLHFRPTMQSVNLTHASVPLSFDIESIRPDQILTWNASLHRAVVSGKPLSLNKHLNFAEALYLPSVLDRILAESRRDLKEFGFAQLRLAVCFLSWADLKSQPVEQFESPLVLLTVRLVKKKGINDTYFLETLETDAEVNPVVRHQFKQLYDIELPETLDLTSTDLDAFYDYLAARIGQSTAAVTLTKLDRPRVEVIHEKAKRKLDQYRRRARIAGRGVRTFGDIDYSYDPANYHPLGIKLFSEKIRPPSTRLREIIEQSPRARQYVAQPEPPVVEKERSFYRIQPTGESNPYTWNFDLCSVTLANFRYRKMSLVRDYEALLEDKLENPAFEATFSLSPRPVEESPPDVPLKERYHVVPCDPTQATAIAEARTGSSYIIQGPPGTGKSQTITNLIADYVARGQRVLFVCEKRAAIDVVYARLRQQGLDELCCLIHDSQADKKEFVMDLKKTYEAFLGEGDEPGGHDQRRKETLKRLRDELRPLEQFSRAMQAVPKDAGVPLRELLSRCLELREDLPQLSALEKERLPAYALWWKNRAKIAALADAVKDLQGHNVFAAHPMRWLSTRLVDVERPLELVTETLASACELVEELEPTISLTGLVKEHCTTLTRAREMVDYADRVSPLAKVRQMSLLEPDGQWWRAFAKDLAALGRLQHAVAETQKATERWRRKLPPTDVTAALTQAKALEGSFLRWLKPSWWRLRAVMKPSYDFAAHAVPPTYTQVLEALDKEHAAVADVERQLGAIGEMHGLRGDVRALVDRVLALREEAPNYPAWLSDFHQRLIGSDRSSETVERILSAAPKVAALTEKLDRILEDHQEQALAELSRDLAELRKQADDLPDYLYCLKQLAALPAELASTLRQLPLKPRELEAAIAEATLENILREDRKTGRFTGRHRGRHAERLAAFYDQWLANNAAIVRQRVRLRFLENVQLASLPDSQLSAEQKEFKKSYARGRKELEHEFGKQMRYKAIRDLVAGDSGRVVADLKPVWLMSPLSVSDTLPLDTEHVDVVIFDEASQITLEEAVPSLFRAGQAIVVGDEMQLPPTDFFSARRPEEDEELMVEEDGRLIQYDLNSNSFLNHSAKNLPSTMLGWHYRSRSESLISFSNWAFYQGRLLTVPDEQLTPPGRAELRAARAEDSDAGADAVLGRAVSFHFMEHGVYDKRRNRAEADYIAHLVRALLRKETGRSIGIVAFSEAQQDEIEAALQRLGQQDNEFQTALDAEVEREENGQFVGLLVKNLENIQGDERDIVILSICYGPGPTGKMLMNFGPINQSGGEKRLNVAFSRAKHHMVVVSSITHAAITNEYNDGANCLKNYLRYAEATSRGEQSAAEVVLRAIAPPVDAPREERAESDAPTDQLAAALVERGYLVDRGVGQSHFRCDLAVRREGDEAYRLGILLDNDGYYSQPDVLERDMMRPKLLRAFGWQVAVVLAKDWCEDADGVVERLSGQLESRAPTQTD